MGMKTLVNNSNRKTANAKNQVDNEDVRVTD